MSEALVVMTAKVFGCLGIIDNRCCLIGVVTDGDLRRHMWPHLIRHCVDSVMSVQLVSIDGNALASTALVTMNRSSITAHVVVESNNPIGVIHIHDLLRAWIA